MPEAAPFQGTVAQFREHLLAGRPVQFVGGQLRGTPEVFAVLADVLSQSFPSELAVRHGMQTGDFEYRADSLSGGLEWLLVIGSSVLKLAATLEAPGLRVKQEIYPLASLRVVRLSTKSQGVMEALVREAELVAEFETGKPITVQAPGPENRLSPAAVLHLASCLTASPA